MSAAVGAIFGNGTIRKQGKRSAGRRAELHRVAAAAAVRAFHGRRRAACRAAPTSSRSTSRPPTNSFQLGDRVAVHGAGAAQGLPPRRHRAARRRRLVRRRRDRDHAAAGGAARDRQGRPVRRDRRSPPRPASRRRSCAAACARAARRAGQRPHRHRARRAAVRRHRAALGLFAPRCWRSASSRCSSAASSSSTRSRSRSRSGRGSSRCCACSARAPPGPARGRRRGGAARLLRLGARAARRAGAAPGLRALFKAIGVDLPSNGLVIAPRTIIVSLLVGTS